MPCSTQYLQSPENMIPLFLIRWYDAANQTGFTIAQLEHAIRIERWRVALGNLAICMVIVALPCLVLAITKSTATADGFSLPWLWAIGSIALAAFLLCLYLNCVFTNTSSAEIAADMLHNFAALKAAFRPSVFKDPRAAEQHAGLANYLDWSMAQSAEYRSGSGPGEAEVLFGARTSNFAFGSLLLLRGIAEQSQRTARRKRGDEHMRPDKERLTVETRNLLSCSITALQKFGVFPPSVTPETFMRPEGPAGAWQATKQSDLVPRA